MRVFVAGASGAIGTRLVPQLVDRGHEVIGTSRSAEKADHIRALGAEPIVLDLLDARAVRKAVLESEPDATGRACEPIAVSTFHMSNQEGSIMASSSTNPSTADLVDGTLAVAAGVGIVTLALFPPAIPIAQLADRLFPSASHEGTASARAATPPLEPDSTSLRYWCTKAIAMLPSPTAAATRFTGLNRTSPLANTPGTLVSSK
jgi:NAD(P)-dependent dehydrogenase (short-subunit alcohol dehydrogenase family)